MSLDELGSDGPKPAEGAPAWMATMADMFSLLLTFFVLLLSFANMDVVKFRMMLGSVKDAFGVQTTHPGDLQARATSPVEFSQSESTPHLDVLDMPTRSDSDGQAQADAVMVQEIEEAVARLDLEKMVEVVGTKRGVVVRVKGQLLFGSGSAKLLPEAFVFLDEIGRLTHAFSHPLAVEGHSDDLAIRSETYESNWDLSAARAIAAVRYLIDVAELDAKLLSVAGFSDTRPIVSNDSPENRARNRRVEFVYLRDAPDSPPPAGSY